MAQMVAMSRRLQGKVCVRAGGSAWAHANLGGLPHTSTLPHSCVQGAHKPKLPGLQARRDDRRAAQNMPGGDVGEQEAASEGQWGALDE